MAGEQLQPETLGVEALMALPVDSVLRVGKAVTAYPDLSEAAVNDISSGLPSIPTDSKIAVLYSGKHIGTHEADLSETELIPVMSVTYIQDDQEIIRGVRAKDLADADTRLVSAPTDEPLPAANADGSGKYVAKGGGL